MTQVDEILPWKSEALQSNIGDKMTVVGLGIKEARVLAAVSD